MRIGICDWGIGGLGFYRLLRADRPDVDVVYLGDQGTMSYGRLPKRELAARIHVVLEGFRERGVSRVVVACNAASTVLPSVNVEGVKATGVIEPTLAVLRRATSSVGVIGGLRTIRSQAYRSPLEASGIQISQRVAQPLSRLIEDGRAGEPSTARLCRNILWPIRHSERLVLACTHYIVLSDVFRETMPNATFVDPATEVWSQMKGNLPPLENRQGTSSFFTTGDPVLMEAQALAAFGVSAKVQAWS